MFASVCVLLGSAYASVLVLNSAPASGLGDRVGLWLVLLAVGKIRNESVLINWKSPLSKMPANVVNDSANAGSCIEFPQPPAIMCGAAKSPKGALPSCLSFKAKMSRKAVTYVAPFRYWWSPSKLKCSKFACSRENYTMGLELVPHVVYGALLDSRLLNASATAHSLDRYLNAYRTLAKQLALRSHCRHPIGAHMLAKQFKGEIVIWIHLRRTDRGGSTDKSAGTHYYRMANAPFGIENKTQVSIHRLMHMLDKETVSVHWMIVSDNRTIALRMHESMLQVRTSHSRQTATISPSSATQQIFFSMSKSDGIVQSVLAHGGWSSYSSVAAMMESTPLLSVQLRRDEVDSKRYKIIANQWPRDNKTVGAREKIFYSTNGEERAFIEAVQLRHRQKVRLIEFEQKEHKRP